MKNRKFYQITAADRTADINIYGEITSYPWEEFGEVSAHDIKAEIDALDVDAINVYINSYGGEVAQALAIYSALKRHPAQVHTYCDGFACSAATIVFCAGDSRTMGPLALMMIHNCMTYLGYANSEEMRKAAEDNDKINQSSIEAYKAVSNLSEEEIKIMMDAETWFTAQECLDYGFATDIADYNDEEGVQQSAFGLIRTALLRQDQNFMQSVDEKLAAILAAVQKDGQDGQDEQDGKDDTADTDDHDNTQQQKVKNFFSLLA